MDSVFSHTWGDSSSNNSAPQRPDYSYLLFRIVRRGKRAGVDHSPGVVR